MKKVLAILSPLALTFAFANPVHAVCDVDRLHVVRSEGAAGGIQIYDFGPATVLPTFYFRFSTNNGQVIQQLNAAWVGNFTVRVVGNAESCPTEGTIRFGGDITFLFRDSFF
jgi:hypothetical protein